MKKKITASFDELIRNRYGEHAGGDTSGYSLRIEDLYAGYYGIPAEGTPHHGRPEASVVLSCTCDDGETLPQRQRRRRSRRADYVVQQSSAAPGVVEYVPERSRGGDDIRPYEECRVDVIDLPQDAVAPAPASPAAPAPVATPPASPPVLAAPQPSSETAAASAKPTDDEFLEDMKSILTGQKMFDPATKAMVNKGRSDPPPRPVPEANNEQAIFARIAQSMQYANAYNLGTIELENRFADFDNIADLERKASAARKAAPKVDSDDFLRDLEAIRAEHAPQGERGYSQPLFDTGEHVRAGGDLYPEHLRVGRPPGVLFSYGQLVAMGDLYLTVDDMMAADPAELQRLKQLIEKSTRHYTAGGPDVSTEEWEAASANRYLKLAENNYEHFSPNPLFKTPAYSKKTTKGDAKQEWERYHRRAIEEAQKLYLASSNASVFPEWPLIINAFGDHFLTDAFAAGHIINKETTTQAFRANFLRGSSLTDDGEKFFQMVAFKAFHGDVARKFSALETADFPVCAHGWCFKWRPNIDTFMTFATLLQKAAEQQPDRIANLAVKALHDRLNQQGLEVVSDVHRTPWTIKGDAYLDDTSLRIMQAAVQQSVDNINDPGIRASNLDFSAYFAKVWRHVPRPTETALAQLARLTKEYTSPTSDALVEAAARLIHKEVDALVKALVDEGKLKAA